MWSLSESQGRIAHQTRAYANIKRVGQILAVVENEAALKALRRLILT